MFCENCGTQLKEEAVFCTNCGAKIRTEKGTVQKKTGKKSKLGLVAVVFFIVLGITAGVCKIVENSAADVSFVKTEEGVAIIESEGKYGIADLYGNLVLPCVYDEISDADENGYMKGRIDESWKKLDILDAAIHISGIPLYDDSKEYHYVTDYDEEGCRWGIDQYNINAYKFNAAGEVEEVYSVWLQHNKCLVLLGENENYLLLFSNGKIVTTEEISRNFFSEEEGMIPIIREGKECYVNEKGEEVTFYQQDYQEGLKVVERDGEYGYINEKGEEIISCQYDAAENFREGLALVRKDWKYGYINKKGEEVIPCQYDAAESLREGLALVRKDEKYGYINVKGEEVIPCQYDMAWSFREGLAEITKGWKYGYINKTGKEILFIGAYYGGQKKEIAEYVNKKECVGYGLCIDEDKIPYAYNGKHIWDMRVLKKTNKYMAKAFTTDKASKAGKYMEKAYHVNDKNICIAYYISQQYEKDKNIQKADKYKEIYNQKIEEVKREHYEKRKKAINSVTVNGALKKTKLTEHMFYLLFDCPKESEAYMEWADMFWEICEEHEWYNVYIKNSEGYEHVVNLYFEELGLMMLELGYYITEEEVLREEVEVKFEEIALREDIEVNQDWFNAFLDLESEYEWLQKLVVRAKRIAKNNTYREREKFIENDILLG